MFDQRLRNEKKMLQLGFEGEKLVKAIYERMGYIVELSEDSWDLEKDMLVDGKTCEVKTQIPVITQNCMAIKTSQYEKCTNVDILIFVEIPYSNKYGVNETVNIYQALDREVREFRTADGRDMLLYPISKMNLIKKVTSTVICKHFESLSNSQV
ncbi:hypothetical protein CMI42_01515 [Candidatus Pacearchaeota archaeon]|nr:hypothetical protein [Candidatus Pacearchaeota archaeon]